MRKYELSIRDAEFADIRLLAISALERLDTVILKIIFEQKANDSNLPDLKYQMLESIFASHHFSGENSENKLAMLKFLVKNKVDLNKYSPQNTSILDTAAFHENTTIIKYLVENGATNSEQSFENLIGQRIGELPKKIIKSAFIISKIFEKDGVENINEDLKNHLSETLSFTTILEKNEKENIKFSDESYQTCFQNLLIIKLRNVSFKGVSAISNLLGIITYNIQKLKLLSSISFEEIYLFTVNSCKIYGNDEQLSLIKIARLNVLKLLVKGVLIEEQIKKILPDELFNKLILNTDEQYMLTANGQISAEISD